MKRLFKEIRPIGPFFHTYSESFNEAVITFSIDIPQNVGTVTAEDINKIETRINGTLASEALSVHKVNVTKEGSSIAGRPPDISIDLGIGTIKYEDFDKVKNLIEQSVENQFNISLSDDDIKVQTHIKSFS